MAERSPPYAPEYRRQMVELVRAGRTPGELAREFECSAQAVRNWVRQADRDEGRREDGLTSADSKPKPRTGSGWPTSPTCRPGRGSCSWPWCSTFSAGASWDGRWQTIFAPSWCSKR